jgi:hypothetical protein
MNEKDLKQMDQMLRTGLRRQSPPADFVEQVLARVEQKDDVSPQKESTRWYERFSHPVVGWAGFAAVAASLVVGTIQYRSVQRERVKGEAAKQQLMLALHIAGSKLQLAKSKVNEMNTSRPESKPETNRSRSKS